MICIDRGPSQLCEMSVMADNWVNDRLRWTPCGKLLE